MLIQSAASQPALSPVPPSAPAQQAAEPAAAETAAATEPALPGVLRHLQAGHYKGVADVRLRIVFHEQLAALATAEAQARVGESAPALAAGVSGVVTAFAASHDGAPPPDAADAPAEAPASSSELAAAALAFEEAVHEATTLYVEGSALGLPDYEATLRDAFDALVGSLQAALGVGAASEPEGAEAQAAPVAAVEEAGPVAAETGTGSVAPADEAPEPVVTEPAGGTDGVEAFFAELRERFARELAVLLEDAVSRDTLPPLGEPAGNGHAWEKFLAVYRELNPPPAPVQEPPGIDVAA